MQIEKKVTVLTMEKQKRTTTMILKKIKVDVRKYTEKVITSLIPVNNNVCVHFSGNNRAPVDFKIWVCGVYVQLFLVAGPSGEPVVGAW